MILEERVFVFIVGLGLVGFCVVVWLVCFNIFYKIFECCNGFFEIG